MTGKKKKTSVLTLVLAYVLSLLLVALAALGVAGITLCNASFLKTQIIRSGFCNEVVSDLTENFVSYGSASGFSADVMKRIIPVERVQSDMFTAVDALYAGNRDMPEYTQFSQNAYGTLAADVEARNYALTAEVQEGLHLLADTCAADYTNQVNIPMASYIAPILAKLKANIWIPIVIAVLFTAVAIVVIVISEKDIETRINACIYSFTAGFAACIAFPLIANIAVNVRNLSISPASLKSLIIHYYSSTLSAFLYFAIMYAVVVIALAITIRLIHKRESMIYAETKIDRIANDNVFGAQRRQPVQPQPVQQTPRHVPNPPKNVRTFGDPE